MNRVKITYNDETMETKISAGEQEFDVSRINGRSINDWAYPFIVKNIRWFGIYEELKAFIGTDDFNILFEGSETSLAVLKDALKNTSVKAAGTNNKVVILYDHEKRTTKMTVNGKIFDTAGLQNRTIDEWIFSFQFSSVKWNGIFKELEDFIGSDVYSIQFVGEQEHMLELMKECPENVQITYRAPAVKGRSSGTPKAGSSNISETVSSAAKNAAHAVQNIDVSAVKGKVSQGFQNVKNVDVDEIKQKSSEFVKNAKSMSADDWKAFVKKHWKKTVIILVVVILVVFIIVKILGAIFGSGAKEYELEDDGIMGCLSCPHEYEFGSVGYCAEANKFLFKCGDHNTVYLLEAENGNEYETTAAESQIKGYDVAELQYDGEVSGADADGDGYVTFTVSEYNGEDYDLLATFKYKK